MSLAACRTKELLTPKEVRVENPDIARLACVKEHAMKEALKFIKDGPERPR